MKIIKKVGWTLLWLVAGVLVLVLCHLMGFEDFGL
jgi:hypothetical protein